MNELSSLNKKEKTQRENYTSTFALIEILVMTY